MVKTQVTTPKGVRDFSPEEVQERNKILSVLRHHFELFGFMPLETGAMENLSTLQGKYGDEGDQLLFRILNSGDCLKGIDADPRTLSRHDLTRAICEKGLRYDLTVPLARYVATHWQHLPHPFRRYQMQPVWRADKPQKGRYREFLQCDVDILGSPSLLCEQDLIDLVAHVFKHLQLPIDIYINHRALLELLAKIMGHPELLVPMTVALDKLEKVGAAAVTSELLAMGFAEESVARLLSVCSQASSYAAIMALQEWCPAEYADELQACLSPIIELYSREGVTLAHERKMASSAPFTLADAVAAKRPMADQEFADESVTLHFSPSLARGLSYYTGIIFEVKIRNAAMGSVCGGGRYDNLTGIFGLEGVTGVGISFGVDRIYDVMRDRGMFDTKVPMADVLVLYNDPEQLSKLLVLANALRAVGIRTLVYPDSVRVKKQFEFANKHGIPWVAEWFPASEALSVRNIQTGEEHQGKPNDTIDWLLAARTKLASAEDFHK